MQVSVEDSPCNGEAHDKSGEENNQDDTEIIHEKNSSKDALPTLLNDTIAAQRLRIHAARRLADRLRLRLNAAALPICLT